MKSELQRLILAQQLDHLNILPEPDSLIVNLTLEEAELEESQDQPMFGFTQKSRAKKHSCENGVVDLIAWFSDGEDSRYEVN